MFHEAKVPKIQKKNVDMNNRNVPCIELLALSTQLNQNSLGNEGQPPMILEKKNSSNYAGGCTSCGQGEKEFQAQVPLSYF